MIDYIAESVDVVEPNAREKNLTYLKRGNIVSTLSSKKI